MKTFDQAFEGGDKIQQLHPGRKNCSEITTLTNLVILCKIAESSVNDVDLLNCKNTRGDNESPSTLTPGIVANSVSQKQWGLLVFF